MGTRLAACVLTGPLSPSSNGLARIEDQIGSMSGKRAMKANKTVFIKSWKDIAVVFVVLFQKVKPNESAGLTKYKSGLIIVLIFEYLASIDDWYNKRRDWSMDFICGLR